MYFYFLLINFETKKTICVGCFLAISFVIAFPPTVKAATIALNNICILGSTPNFSINFNVIKALKDPLNTPAYISYYISAKIRYFWRISN